MSTRDEQLVHGLSVRVGHPEAIDIGHGRTLCLTRQAPVRRDGSVPEGFWEQAQLAWDNVESALLTFDMTLSDIVEHTVLLGDPRHASASDDMQRKVLGPTRAARSVVTREIELSEWFLEVEIKALSERLAAPDPAGPVEAERETPDRHRGQCREPA